VSYQVPWWQVEYGPSIVSAVSDAATNRQLSQGVIVEKFEYELARVLQSQKIIGVTSGSDAILLSLIAVGVGQGSKVLVQDRSWIAAANAVHLLGGQVVIVDVDENSKMDLKDLSSKYTQDVSGVIVVPMNGRFPDMTKLREFCDERHLFLVEDAAQALGSITSKGKIGTLGDLGCFSFSSAKVVGSGQGGAISVNRLDLWNIILESRLHGTTSVFDADWRRRGFNFRFTDLHAAIALTQLPLLLSRIERLKEIQRHYVEGLHTIEYGTLHRIDFENGEVGPYVEFILNDPSVRKKFIQHLKESGIEVRPFYPSITEAKYLNSEGNAPNSKKFAKSGVYLPSGPALSDEQIKQVTQKMKSLSKGFI
jgi:perosamine synthetase